MSNTAPQRGAIDPRCIKPRDSAPLFRHPDASIGTGSTEAMGLVLPYYSTVICHPYTLTGTGSIWCSLPPTEAMDFVQSSNLLPLFATSGGIQPPRRGEIAVTPQTEEQHGTPAGCDRSLMHKTPKFCSSYPQSRCFDRDRFYEGVGAGAAILFYRYLPSRYPDRDRRSGGIQLLRRDETCWQVSIKKRISGKIRLSKTILK